MGPGSRSLRSLVRDDSEFVARKCSRSHGLISPELCKFIGPPRLEGAGKTGRRLRPQHRVQRVERNAHGFDRYSRDIPAFPAQWLYGLYVLSPGSGLSCPRCGLGLTSPRSARVAAPGPHDFAVRGECLVRQKPDTTASIATRANVT